MTASLRIADKSESFSGVLFVQCTIDGGGVRRIIIERGGTGVGP